MANHILVIQRYAFIFEIYFPQKFICHARSYERSSDSWWKRLLSHLHWKCSTICRQLVETVLALNLLLTVEQMWLCSMSIFLFLIKFNFIRSSRTKFHGERASELLMDAIRGRFFLVWEWLWLIMIDHMKIETFIWMMTKNCFEENRVIRDGENVL